MSDLELAASSAATVEVTQTATRQPATTLPVRDPGNPMPGDLRRGMIGFVLAHEQFTVPDLIRTGAAAARAGFELLATSDHLQPWQANEAHSGAAWVTLGAMGAQVGTAWLGTSVTCPTMRYNPAVVAEAFATLSYLYPGRVFLGVGSGEALNEQAATGNWPAWQERWDRLIEAIAVIRRLWTGEHVSHNGAYYRVNANLLRPAGDAGAIFVAANGKSRCGWRVGTVTD